MPAETLDTPLVPASDTAAATATPGAVPVSRLALRRVAIDTWRENVAYLHRDCAVYRAEGFQALSKVDVRANGRHVLATVNVVDDPCIVGCNELGLSEDAFAQLGVPNGYMVAVSQAEPPESMGALFRKISGERLARADFHAIVRDIAERHYSKIELTAFVVACHRDELDREEVFFLSDAMVASGQWPAPGLARTAGGGQALHRRYSGQPHLHADRAHRGCARHAVPQNIVACHHLARRHR